MRALGSMPTIGDIKDIPVFFDAGRPCNTCFKEGFCPVLLRRTAVQTRWSELVAAGESLNEPVTQSVCPEFLTGVYIWAFLRMTTSATSIPQLL